MERRASAASKHEAYHRLRLLPSVSRSDANENLNETFTYDSLDRLISSTVNFNPTPLVKTFTYDPIGNLLSKSDVGNYTYPAAGSARPHGVTSISGGTISTTFAYDANGNQTSGLGRTVGYTSFNKPSSTACCRHDQTLINKFDARR